MADLQPDKHGIPRYKFRIQRIGIEIEGAWKPKPVKGAAAPVGPVFTAAEIAEIHLAASQADRDGRGRFAWGAYVFHTEQVLSDPLHPLTENRPTPPTAPLFKDATPIKGDPSVKFTTTTGLAAIGEVVSEPLIRPALWLWMRDHYPDVVNRTCGIHVHMSLRHELDYQRLIDRAYHDHILLGLHRWGMANKLPADHVFWPRIRGCNLFAQDVFHGDFQARYKAPDAQGRNYHDHRYGMINYCWSVHKTLEVRVLPTFADVKTAIRAVRRVLNLTEEFLAKARGVAEPEHRLIVPVPAMPELAIRVGHTAELAARINILLEGWQVFPQDYQARPDPTVAVKLLRPADRPDEPVAPAPAEPPPTPDLRRALYTLDWDDVVQPPTFGGQMPTGGIGRLTRRRVRPTEE